MLVYPLSQVQDTLQQNARNGRHEKQQQQQRQTVTVREDAASCSGTEALPKQSDLTDKLGSLIELRSGKGAKCGAVRLWSSSANNAKPH
jgi:hypothetical protein